MPPTFSYCYERNDYFFANFCKQCAILPEMAKETDIEFLSKLQRPICWCWQLAQKFPEETLFTRNTGSKRHTIHNNRWASCHNLVTCHNIMISSTEICYRLISTSVSWQPRNASCVINWQTSNTPLRHSEVLGTLQINSLPYSSG